MPSILGQQGTGEFPRICGSEGRPTSKQKQRTFLHYNYNSKRHWLWSDYK